MRDLRIDCNLCNGNGYLGNLPPLNERDNNVDNYKLPDCIECKGIGYFNYENCKILFQQLSEKEAVVKFSIVTDPDEFYYARIMFKTIKGIDWVEFHRCKYTEGLSEFEKKDRLLVTIDRISSIREVKLAELSAYGN